MRSNVIRLWDLGCPGSDAIHPSSTVALMTQPSECDIYLQWMAWVCIWPRRYTSGQHWLESWFMRYTHRSHRHFSMKVFGRAQFLRVSGQRLACLHGLGSKVVWDMTNDLTAHWSMHMSFLSQISGLHIWRYSHHLPSRLLAVDYTFSQPTYHRLSRRSMSNSIPRGCFFWSVWNNCLSRTLICSMSSVKQLPASAWWFTK